MAMFETQTEKRARLDKKTLNRAYANLANSVTRKPQFFYSGANDTNALDDAVRTCLAHYHIEISGFFTDLNHIDYIVRKDITDLECHMELLAGREDLP
jgi:hypothetical protein